MTTTASSPEPGAELPLFAVQLTRAVRRLLRWSWLVVFVLGTVLWVASFDCGGIFVVLLCGVLWFAIGVIAAIAWLVESMPASKQPGAVRAARPSWGLPVWLLSPVVIGVCVYLQVDARIWFAVHRTTLEQRAQAIGEATNSSTRLGGFDVIPGPAPGVVAFVTINGADMQGYLLDPAGAVRPGDRCSWLSGYRIHGLLDLGGGWRAFQATS